MPQVSHPAFGHMSKPESLTPTPKNSAPAPVYTVAPPEDESALFERQMAVQNQAFAEQAPKFDNGLPGIMDDAVVQAQLERKKIFDKLILFKQDHTTEVNLNGLKFKLKLLNANDNAFVLKQMKSIPSDEQVSKLAIMVLAAAIVDVNGMSLEEVYNGPSEITEPVLQRYFELNQWPSAIVNALSDAYHKFQKSTEKEYTKNFLEP